MNEFSDSKLSNTFYIRDVETMKVLVSTLRTRILSVLIQGAHTVKEVSQILNVPPNRLYYHFNLMEQFKLIQVVETRMISGILEKHYRSSAVNYLVDPSLLATRVGRNGLVMAGSSKDLIDISAEKHTGISQDGSLGLSEIPNGGMDARKMTWMVPGRQANEIYAKIETVIQEYIQTSPVNFPQADSQNPHMIAVAKYPVRQTGRDGDRVEYSQENHEIP